MIGLDRQRREVHVAAVRRRGRHRVTPQREFRYDTLVIAVGSLSNDFGTPGCHGARDRARDARARRALPPPAGECLHPRPRAVRAAAARAAAASRSSAPAPPASSSPPSCTAPRARSSRTGSTASTRSSDLKITSSRRRSASCRRCRSGCPRRDGAADGPRRRRSTRRRAWPRSSPTACGSPTGAAIPAELVVWAAGIKAPDFLNGLAGLETNRINQLVVLPTLQTTRDERIFAFGDCAACPWPEKNGSWCRRARRPRTSRPRTWRSRSSGCLQASRCAPYRYRDFGSLVSLGEYSTVGNLMGALVGGSLSSRATSPG